MEYSHRYNQGIMNARRHYNIILSHIECLIEKNKFLEYAFGISFSEIPVTFNERITNIVAYKKMLHCLETVKYQISDNKELKDEHFERIEILKLKLENKLNMVILENENRLENMNKNLYSQLKSETTRDEIFENNLTTFVAKNYLDQSVATTKDNMEQETIDYYRFDKKTINDQFKDELVELAEAMKYSAFKFQELLGKERKVSFKERKKN
ncbi:uncharacterized protein cubi_00629 [Cryptosporidium ubiquitum]|uniref:Uncharacterized protein n=1 Tax=Cryptosporidium ubiquitum TaxID=857276 RepID=A0A1J4MG41_9CRYT|nr:uncharacterized protein cubi_00629 [Cryptosporidium ubiquitum]OII71821.1 hypothetical protein cubi_00629 [Cryptosporidium ubiquitum]